MCCGCIHHDLIVELVFSHCTFNSLENIDDGPIEHQYWVGSAQQLTWNIVRSKIIWDLFVNNKVVGSRVHDSEIDLLEDIFGVTAPCCENNEYSKLQLCEVLFALTGYGQSWKCTKFSIFGTPCTINDPTPFVFEPSSWYVMADSSDAIILLTIHFSVYVWIACPVSLMLLELGALSTPILVESSFWRFHCLPNISLATVITAETTWCLEQWCMLMSLSIIV